jgi:zinc transport system substrate-binding protein
LKRYIAGAVVFGLALSACSSATTSTPEVDTSPIAPEVEKISVAASFYPLAYVAEQVLAGVADVNVIAAGNAEPHDFELSPSHIATITSSDFAIYIPDFMPEFDSALSDLAPEQIIDATNEINLLEASHDDEAHDEDAEHDHEEEGHDEDAEHDHGDADPHLWLNPLNMTTIANQISAVVIAQNPELSETINTNLNNFKNIMTDLDNQYQANLANCKINTLLVSHEAFGYLADQYGFTQLGISGVSPEAEPSPARLAEVAKVANEINATTIYYETIVDPSVANTLASEIGLVTAVLDPIETKPENGDYLYAMQENLKAIILGQGCS